MTPEEIKKRLHARRICCVVPTFNNERTVVGVVEELKRFCADIFVVNDGSTDTTRCLLEEVHGIEVLTHTTNRGKGSALRTAFQHATAQGFNYAITLDADAQHFPKDIETFLKENIAHPHALIVGERNLKGVERSGGSSFANHFSNFWFAVQTGQYLRDTQTGFRLYPLRKLVGLRLLTLRYEAELELLVWASWAGVEILSAPISVYYPPREERVSHFRPLRDFSRITVFNTIFTLLSFVVGWPLKICRLLLRACCTVYSLLFFLASALVVFMPWMGWLRRQKTIRAEQRTHLRRAISRFSRIVMIKHGIPGVRFSCEADAVQLLPALHPATPVELTPTFWEMPRVIVCNHQSWLDLMSLLQLSPRIVVVTNSWVWNNPFFGHLIQEAEYLPASMGIDKLMPRLQNLVIRGYSIAIFPEGTRSLSAKLGRFHKGALELAEALHLDVLPLCLTGVNYVLGKGKYYLRHGKISLLVGAPIKRETLDELGTTRQQTSALHKAYERWLDTKAE